MADLTVVGQDTVHQPKDATPVAEWGGGVVMAWLVHGPFGYKLKLARSNGSAFGDPIDLGRAVQPVSLCTVGNELVVAWAGKGLRANVNILWSRGGQLGQPLNLRGVQTASVCALDNELIVAWRQGRDYFLGFLRNGRLVPALQLPIRSWINRPLGAIGMCQHGPNLMLAWQGQHRGIHIARLRRAT